MHDTAVPGTIHYTAKTFNRLCYALALLWIAGSVQLSLHVEPTEAKGHEYHDFSQFYMGGLIARHAAWDAMYPIPHIGSLNSPGEWEDSEMRPAYADLAAAAGVPAHSSRFIQPPTFALALQPIAYLKYHWAKIAWQWLMIFCMWGVAVIAGRTFELSAGRRSRWAGIVSLLVAFTPMTLDAQRLMNVSPFIALTIGVAILGLLQRNSDGGAAALVVGAASKYATAILLPLYVALRKWRALIFMAVLSAGIIGGSLAVMGKGPFVTFFREMVPTFSRVHMDPWNRSLPAAVSHLIQVMHHAEKPEPLAGAAKWGVRVAQWGSLLGLLAILFLKPQDTWTKPSNVFAAAAALLAWFLMFSPILWDHYFLYLMPLWGWLIWEARQSFVTAVLVVLAIAYQFLPDIVLEGHAMHSLHARSPWIALALDSAMLAIAIVVLLIAVSRLIAFSPATVASAEKAYWATPKQFNRVCAAVSLLWLACIIPYSLHLPTARTNTLFGALGRGDFHQFYMGGTIARHQMWNDLYPIPHKNSLNNPGMPEDSDMTPAYFDIAKKVRVGNRLRFIQPPPVAVLLVPLAYIPFERAFGVWIAISILCGWGLAWTGCRVLETLRGRRSKAGGLLMLLIATSPIMLHSIRVANMTLPVAFCMGLAALAIVQRNDALGGLVTMLGAVTKYATLAVIPVAIAARRWRFVICTLLFTALLFGATFALCKSGPFIVYFRDISPTLTRTHGIPSNQSIYAFLTHVEQQVGNLGPKEPLQKVLRWTVLAAETITLVFLLWLIFRKPPVAWNDPGTVYAGITTTLCVMLIFAPVFWEHYAMYLCPLWGWMLWEGWRSKAKLPLAVLGIASMYVPWTYLMDWREPANSHILFGTIALLGMGIWTLLGKSRESVVLERASRDNERPVLPDVQEQPGAEVAR